VVSQIISPCTLIGRGLATRNTVHFCSHVSVHGKVLVVVAVVAARSILLSKNLLIHQGRIEMQAYCAYCYAAPEKLLCCGSCQKRKYCSKDCQRLDWKQCHHKHFCKTGVGEIGIDWEVKESPTVSDTGGLGVFALRAIYKDEIIMTERPIVQLPTPSSSFLGFRLREETIPLSAKPAVLKLHPPNGALSDKFQLNCMSLTDVDQAEEAMTGLFIQMSRVNHHCLGNSTHRYLENRKVKILVASRNIEEGEEITFSYVSQNLDSTMRKAKLGLNYNFTCRCSVCNNPDLEAELERMKELDDAILSLGSAGNVELAMRKGKALIKLYDRHGISSWIYQRTYYDLYQVAITKRKTWSQGVKFINKAYDSALAFTSDENCGTNERFCHFTFEPPKLHAP
jgi:SET domain/MYND finger